MFIATASFVLPAAQPPLCFGLFLGRNRAESRMLPRSSGSERKLSFQKQIGEALEFSELSSSSGLARIFRQTFLIYLNGRHLSGILIDSDRRVFSFPDSQSQTRSLKKPCYKKEKTGI